ncbi:hypothetical protein F383_08768 [Gossypium arboreum]|uniref:Uncharacterized protein n=1 Tax=Gossypium arboreum TaxID=29729 RepID=A0A0B0NN10_GOSAR|nr:hypothetical protein F383_08768 [Gossypium arboreum]
MEPRNAVLFTPLGSQLLGFWQRHQLAHTCSILMEGSLVETHPILEAGCVVPPGQRIPSGELGAGNLAWYTKKH